MNRAKTPQKINYRLRVEELEEKIINKDRTISELQGEIGDLTIKLRKYKKRFESTGIKE